MADGQVPRGRSTQDSGEPLCLGGRPDDQGAEDQPTVQAQAPLIGPPPPPGQQLQDQDQSPGQPDPGSGERRMRPEAHHRQQDDADTRGSDNAAKLLGWRQVLGGVQVEGLEHGDPKQRAEGDDEALPQRQNARSGVADVVRAHQSHDDAHGVRYRQSDCDAPVAAQRAMRLDAPAASRRRRQATSQRTPQTGL